MQIGEGHFLLCSCRTKFSCVLDLDSKLIDQSAKQIHLKGVYCNLSILPTRLFEFSVVIVVVLTGINYSLALLVNMLIISKFYCLSKLHIEPQQLGRMVVLFHIRSYLIRKFLENRKRDLVSTPAAARRSWAERAQPGGGGVTYRGKNADRDCENYHILIMMTMVIK